MTRPAVLSALALLAACSPRAIPSATDDRSGVATDAASASDRQAALDAPALVDIGVVDAAPVEAGAGDRDAGGQHDGSTFDRDAGTAGDSTAPFDAAAPADATAAADTAPRPDAGAPAGPTIQRLGDTFEIATVAGGKRQAMVAYDPVDDVYLVVHGQGPVGGAFVSGDGVPVGAPFQIPETSAWTQTPDVTWFASASAFLVTWHDTRVDPQRGRVYARLVGYDNGAPTRPAADVQVNPDQANQEILPALGCAAPAAECLVAWQRAGGALVAQRIDGSGQLAGGPIELSPADWNSDPVVASAAGSDRFLVAHAYWSDATQGITWVHQVQIGSGSVLGAAVNYGQGGGHYVAQAQWDPVRARFLVAWWQGALVGRFAAADGTALGAAFALVPGFGAYDGFALAYNESAGMYAAVLHGQDAEDWAAAIAADGTSGPAIAATASPAGTTGNYNPRVAARGTRREWLLVTVRGFASVVGQRLSVP